MKALALFLSLIAVSALSTGCNSGTMRGIGADVSNLGDKMQR